MLKKGVLAVAIVIALLCLVCTSEYGKAQEGSPLRGLRVTVHYKGSGAVDEKHKILLFLFDSPDFGRNHVMPFAAMSTSSKDGAVTFNDVAKSPAYVGAVYDPSGNYAERQGPPPSGSSLGIYSKTPGQPAPVKVEAGKTVEVEFTFDDSVKMP
ncbi:MAG: hypothetical protein ABLQ96_11860 [Candidatus Acidiferrum sp.]